MARIAASAARGVNGAFIRAKAHIGRTIGPAFPIADIRPGFLTDHVAVIRVADALASFLENSETVILETSFAPSLPSFQLWRD